MVLLWRLTHSGPPQPRRCRSWSLPGERMKPLLFIGLVLRFAGFTGGVPYIIGGFVVLVLRSALVTLEEMNAFSAV